MHVCLIASSVKMIIKRVTVVYGFKSARMVSVMLRLICVSLGCDMPIQLVLSSKYVMIGRSLHRLAYA